MKPETLAKQNIENFNKALRELVGDNVELPKKLAVTKLENNFGIQKGGVETALQYVNTNRKAKGVRRCRLTSC